MSTATITATVPRNWRRMPTAALEATFEVLDEDHTLFDDIDEELSMRSAMRRDDRIAEAFGAPWIA